MSTSARPTVENERQFLFHQMDEMMRRRSRPDETDRTVTIRFESPTMRYKRVTFNGTPDEVIDQISHFGSHVARELVRR